MLLTATSFLFCAEQLRKICIADYQVTSKQHLSCLAINTGTTNTKKKSSCVTVFIWPVKSYNKQWLWVPVEPIDYDVKWEMENIPSWGQSRKITIRFKLSGNMLPQEKYFYNRFGLKACMDFDLWFWYGLIRKWDVPKICHWTWNEVLPIVDYGTAAKFTRNDRVSERICKSMTTFRSGTENGYGSCLYLKTAEKISFFDLGLDLRTDHQSKDFYR